MYKNVKQSYTVILIITILLFGLSLSLYLNFEVVNIYFDVVSFNPSTTQIIIVICSMAFLSYTAYENYSIIRYSVNYNVGSESIDTIIETESNELKKLKSKLSNLLLLNSLVVALSLFMIYTAYSQLGYEYDRHFQEIDMLILVIAIMLLALSSASLLMDRIVLRKLNKDSFQ